MTLDRVSSGLPRRHGADGACKTSSTSNCRRRPEDDRALRRQHAAIAVGDRGLAIGNLTRTGFAAQLPHRLDQQEQPVHAGVAIGQAAASGVDRQTAARRDMAAGYERAALALRAEAEILQKKDRV